MKTQNIKIFIPCILFLFVALFGCKSKEWVESRGNGPTITIASEFENISGINVGDQVTIPVQIQSQVGIRRFSYFFVTETANGTTSGSPTHIDRTDFPTQLSENISFAIAPAMVELVLVSFDRDNNASELHVPMSEIRKLPVIAFQGGTNFRQTVFLDRHFHLKGNVVSEEDLQSITYETMVNNSVADAGSVTITNKKDQPFDIDILVPEGLNAVVITAKNIYNGTTIDTFKIGGVAEDAVNITLANNATAIANVYIDSTNVLSGEILSGSDIATFTYAIKVNGSYGAEQDISVGTPANTFPFSANFEAATGMEAIRITAINESGLQDILEVPINRINRRLLRFSNIVLTTEVGAGKSNWFGAWRAPHAFDITNSPANQEMIDFGFIWYNNASFRFGPPFLYTAGTAYFNSMAPYMVGFTKATYSVVSANRRSVTQEAMDTLLWDHNLDNFINVNIKGPGPIGENYNISTTNRRISGDPVPGAGFVIGWGTWNLSSSTAINEAFGVVLVKSFVNSGGGKGTVTLDIVVPSENMRAKYNPVSMFGYPTP